jgi:hypothetical protein
MPGMQEIPLLCLTLRVVRMNRVTQPSRSIDVEIGYILCRYHHPNTSYLIHSDLLIYIPPFHVIRILKPSSWQGLIYLLQTHAQLPAHEDYRLDHYSVLVGHVRGTGYFIHHFRNISDIITRNLQSLSTPTTVRGRPDALKVL